MQIVSNRDSLHEMSNANFEKKKNEKNITNVSSAELARRVVTVKQEHSVQ